MMKTLYTIIAHLSHLIVIYQIIPVFGFQQFKLENQFKSEVRLLILNRFGDSTSQNEFVDKMFQQYDRRERPNLFGEPTAVALDLYVNSINKISEISMEYSINLFLRQTWLDQRLAINNQSFYNKTLTLNHEYITKMWRPDIVVKNEMFNGDFHDITVPNILLSLSPNGTLLYSQRISTKLSCYMLLHRFPFDIQTCSIDLESYGNTDEDLVFHWKNLVNPVQFNEQMKLPEFNITGYHLDSRVISYVTGNFSSLRAMFKIERLYNYYLIQVYIPSILIVFLSWISFWIDVHAVPARISVGLLTVLTITTQTTGITASLPKVSYVKAIDVWMFVSTLFVAGGFLEYALVNVLARRFKRCCTKYVVPVERNGLQGPSLNDTMTPDDVRNISASYSCTCCDIHGSITSKTLCTKGPAHRAKMVDFVSRILFPVLFIAFNVVYWAYIYASKDS